MSKTVEYPDSLSDLLRKMHFSARVFFRDEYCGTWAIDTSGSSHIAFHLVTQGQAWLHSEELKPQQLLPGHLVLFPHDDSHVLSSSKQQPDKSSINIAAPNTNDGAATRLVCGYFELDRLLASPLLAGLPATIVMNLMDSPNVCTRDLVQHLMREAAEKNPGSDLAVDRIAELVFIEVLRNQSEIKSLTGIFKMLGDRRLSEVLTAIHQNPGDSHTLENLAKQTNLSESALTQRFKSSLGMTPGKYVKHWRLHTAARLLLESQKSMHDIAANVGYESEVAFRKAFKQYFNQSPGAYRRQN